MAPVSCGQREGTACWARRSNCPARERCPAGRPRSRCRAARRATLPGAVTPVLPDADAEVVRLAGFLAVSLLARLFRHRSWTLAKLASHSSQLAYSTRSPLVVAAYQLGPGV